ncbi:hypothetical protein SCHPADRAFT_929503 [Schizopora paradoxa]|uniref:Uncharacterized protein n=1 Tax=Schizopora paradoxa TaxID=27342 RepID=A0A0H2RRF4_9AGAM|nr:hypothetical protein SCHPADRAFT_929503 [Schizopora paradoxa]
MSQKVLIFGGSKNIGYYSGLRLLEKGATVCYQLRRPNIFDNDEEMQKYITSGKAIIIPGDALKEDDVRRAWEKAAEDGVPVDTCIFTVGGYPSFSITKGFVQDPHNLCTACMLNVLATMPRDAPPKLIFLSSVGLTKETHKAIPFALKPVYGVMLKVPHNDKLGMETAVAYAAGWTWKDVPPEGVLPEGWRARLPESGFEKHVVLVRAALLTDGKSKGDKEGNKAYRVSQEELGGYTISRRDIAHFIVEQALQEWEKFEGKVLNVGY